MAFNTIFLILKPIRQLSFDISLEAFFPASSFLLFPFGLVFCILATQLWFGNFPLPSSREFPLPLSCMDLLFPKTPVFLFISLYPVMVSISFHSFLKKWQHSPNNFYVAFNHPLHLFQSPPPNLFPYFAIFGVSNFDAFPESCR